MDHQTSSHIDPSTKKYFVLDGGVAGTPIGGATTSAIATAGMRVRTPSHADVLCGRGGGINSHEGNIAFRDLVKKEKELYNVAADKDQKAKISDRVIELVRNRGGTFRTKDADGWWVEIDYAKAMAKTSQALREGAPSIRAKAARKQMKMKRRANKAGGRAGTSSKVRGYSSKKIMRRQPSDSSTSEKEEHPIIRGFPNGRRGKILIPVQKKEEAHVEPEHPLIRGSPDGQRGKMLVPVVHPPSPPLPPIPTALLEDKDMSLPVTSSTAGEVQVHYFPKQDAIVTPTLLPIPLQHEGLHTMPPVLPVLPSGEHADKPSTNAPGSYPNDSFSLPAPMDLSPVKYNHHPADVHPATVLAPPLNIMDPDTNYGDIVKPDIGCARMHSLAFSDLGCIEGFRGDEAFANPFEDEDENNLGKTIAVDMTNNHMTKGQGLQEPESTASSHININESNNSSTDLLRAFYPTPPGDSSSEDLSIAKVNAVLKFRSSDSTFGNSNDINNGNGKRSVSPSSPVEKKAKNDNEDNGNGGMIINPMRLKSLR
eukprot:CAMPEP_0204621582 /NCGR_PEP_ID=MMETSP0717-20131115/7229_1 /ASSEMBLY_ACC=CAM_ASM_000666 /TAXON_ID=230516 /ORGANISM="Chaetoceros curvisetus" /LENGTH=538 /DNA_ID=CAMNT_0051636011 /DNA_START=49 /DNA_END=1665 /DNA_ORIENTATION=-